MSKKLGFVTVSFFVLILCAGTFLYKEDSNLEVPQRDLVTKEVLTDSYHLRLYIEDDTEYLEDVLAGEVIPLRKVNGGTLPAMDLGEGYAVAEFSHLYGTSIVDPVTINIGIEPSIPFTYTSSLEQSSVYLETLLYDGWEIVGIYRDKGYIDLYLTKGSVLSRIIILDNSIKIFHKIKGNLPDPQTYINERKDGQ